MLAKGFSIIYKPNTKENNTQQEISFILKKLEIRDRVKNSTYTREGQNETKL